MPILKPIRRPGPGGVFVTSPTPRRLPAATPSARLAAAQSGQLPPPAKATAAAGNSPLQVAQAAMAVGEPIPVIWGRRRNNVGGVLVFPKATEARFENTSSTVTSRYHMVLGEGRMPDIQVRDVRCGECRIGTFSQNYDQRAGSWSPGNFATAQAGYTVPTFPTFTGGGGNYQGLSTFEAGATFPGGSDDWRTGWNVFLRGGMIVERGRLLDSTVDSSDNIADLVLWALQRSGRVPDAMIDFPSLVAAARFTEANGLWLNGEFSDSGNLGDWLIRILPDFLLRETKVGGKFGLRPLLPTNSDGTINSGAIAPSWVLTEAAIKPDSYRIEYSGAASSRPTPLAMIWRQQHDATDVPIVRTLPVGEPNAPGPPEQHDLSQVATVEDHALRVGTYRYARRQLSTHTATVALKPGNQTGQIVEGDVVQVWLQVISSREPAGEINRFYVVETIGHDLAGNETLSLSHLPVNSSGQSLIALAVAAATPSGTILPSNRTGSSCDLPGAAADTSVPAKTTSGTPIYPKGGRGGSADPYGGAGAPVDSAPTPGSQQTSPVLRLASGNSGIIKPIGTNALGGDSRCPYGYNQVSGAFIGGQVLQADMATCGQTTSFVATSFPSVSVGPWETYGIFKLQTVTVSWNHPTEGAKEETTQTIISQNPSIPFECIFSIRANSYSCKLSNGAAGPTVTGKLYKVVAGDTMASISQRMYGTTSRATDILNANQIGSESLFGLTLSGADWLMWPGLILNIPD